MFRENIFSKAKRHISQLWETEWWYRFRKIHRYWLDVDTGRWEKCVPQDHARDIITSTWEGENDLWGAMLLKLDHMFWSLRKYGEEKKYYFWSLDAATKEDRRFLAAKKLEDALLKEGEVYLCNAYTDSYVISNDGIVNFYLKYYENEAVLLMKTHKQIPPETIPKKKKLYTLKTWRDSEGKLHWSDKNEAPQYRNIESAEICRTVRHPGDFAGIARVVIESLRAWVSKSVNDFEIETDLSGDESEVLERILLERTDDIDLEIKDLPSLSPQLRATAAGNFVKCRDILHLRRLIKNLLKMDNLDDKYNTWRDAKSEEEKNERFKNDRETYQRDRKEAYQKICDFMCEKAQLWWD